MKLIVEKIENVEFLTEATKDGKKNHFIKGVFMQAGIKNRNGRIYPIHILQKEVSRYQKEAIEQGRAVGELNHPDSPQINLDRVSHKIISLEQSGNDFIGKAKILDTPNGQIVKNLLDEGISLGVSSRGMGSLKQIDMNTMEVQEDFYLATAADIVADPSAPSAFVEGILEGKEWVRVGNEIVEKHIHRMQETIKAAPKSKRTDVAIKEFDSFLKNLK